MLAEILAAALAAQIPFELRSTLFGLTNLQWTFLAFAATGTPLLLQRWKLLARDRLVQAAALFVITQWAAALYAPEFHGNAVKAAVRFSAGLVLFAVMRSLDDAKRIYRVWALASIAAAAYAVSAYAGFGVPWLFRDQEFYIGQVQRLSGSFEYPNTAAAYYALSLPIVCWAAFRPALKWVGISLLWIALILTFSKGALAAVALAMLAAGWPVALKVLGTGAAAYAVLLPLNPYMFEYIYGPGRNPIAVEYKTPWNSLIEQPGAQDQIRLQIRNTGFRKWRAQGMWRVAISYRWLNSETKNFSPVTRLVTNLPHDVEPGGSVDIPVSFQTPADPGKYLLAIELYRHDFDWFSRTGVFPAMVEAEIRPAVTRSVGMADLSEWYKEPQDTGMLTASVPRSQLWRAALRMFRDHPFGIGPDNFRLEYGKYLGVQRWDTHLYSNNLYLELLTGSGVLGVFAFVLVLLALRWRRDAGCLALAVFLLHGLVDVFLMTTPVYFAFWLLLADNGNKVRGE